MSPINTQADPQGCDTPSFLVRCNLHSGSSHTASYLPELMSNVKLRPLLEIPEPVLLSDSLASHELCVTFSCSKLHK